MGSKHFTKTRQQYKQQPGKVNTLLNKKLEKVEWGEFKLGDLFKSSNGDFDLQKEHLNNLGEYVITAGLTNNGISGKTDIDARIFDKKTITIDMFGYAFFRPFKYKMVTHARVFSLKPNFEISENQGLFLVNSFSSFNKKFGYENMCSWNKIKSDKIQLPTKNGKIDFEFMESFIAELETEHIAKLEAYLEITGLKDYTLTKEEEKLLKEYDDEKFTEFKVVDVFDVKNSGNILSREIIKGSGKTPYLCASTENNAVSSYIAHNETYLDKGDCVFIGGKTFVVTYQEKDFYSNDSHNLVLYLKNEKEKNKSNQLFLATCVNKGLKHKYSWGNSISNRKIQTDKIKLPTKNNKPDYKKMETIVSALQKQIIKDVVLYTENKLSSSTS